MQKRLSKHSIAHFTPGVSEEFSRALMRLYDRMELASMDSEEKQALGQLKQRALKEQMIRGTRDLLTKRELRRITHEEPNLPFYQFREQALHILRDVDEGTVASCMGVCPPTPGDIESVDTVVSGRAANKPVHRTSDSELLRGLVDGQKQLCSSMKRIVQQQAETNTHIQKLSEVMVNQKTSGSSQGNFQKRKSQVQCTYCSKRGHTIESCYKREYDLKKASNNAETDAKPSVQNLVAEIHTSENLTPPS